MLTPVRTDALLPLAASPLAWLAPLLEAATPRAVALATAEAMRTLPGCRGVRVLWALDDADSAWSEPAQPIDSDDIAADLDLAREALDTDMPRLVAGHRTRLAIPLRRSGAAVLMELEPRQSPQAMLELAADRLQVADQRLRSALEIAELHGTMARLEHSELVQRALFAISDLAGSNLAEPDLLKGIHAIVGTLMYAENCFIVRLDAQNDLIRFLYFVDVEDEVPSDEPLSRREGTLTWYLLRDGKPLRGSDAQLRRQVSGPLRSIGTDSFDWLGVPMVRDGVVEGAIVVQSYQPGIVYSAADQALLEFVGSHILTALERKRTQDDLERSVRQRTLELAEANLGLHQEIIERERAQRLQAALFQIAQLATADIDEEAFYRSIHEVVGELTNARNFFIALLSSDRASLEYPYAVDDSGEDFATRPVAHGLSEYVLRHGQSLLRTEEVRELAARGEVDLYTVGALAECWLGVPLIFGGEAVGLVAVQSYDPSVLYGPADQELLGFVASQIANSLHRRRTARVQQEAFAQLEERVQARTHELRQEIGERERIQERLKHEVMHDTLTGLPNRGYLRSRLNHVLARLGHEPQRKCALLYLDVDRFKVINDSLGHLAGDEVLKEVAVRLQACVREPDLVARLSGDEFVILLEDVDGPATAIKVAQRVLDLLDRPLQVAGKVLAVSGSVGIAVADARYGLADELVRDADTALYRAKSLGRKCFVLFDASLQREAIDVLALEGELRDALEHDQFEPYFQPILRLASDELVGYEALLRWNHPTRGVLGPPEFLQVAEDCGVIEAIDWRMFELSCERAARLDRVDTYLTINVSPRHLRHADFDTRLIDMLARTGLSPTRLLIEITEGSLLDDPECMRATLARLQAAGIGAALDDFGTGYSSLSYLHSFPMKKLKIDRSFVVALGSQGEENHTSVVAAILALAGALGLGVVAEGIETQQQRDALAALGCEYGQGFLLGRPAPMAHWLGRDA
ncbi:EAL domain-containing protein [Lysobacter koreensis]|uniref:EAL domain-containing protein n=1 Tax=Lysobacter koreensis TaxID=266122 RepID=A0ABW2YKP0_9GAMM